MPTVPHRVQKSFTVKAVVHIYTPNACRGVWYDVWANGYCD